MVPATESPGFPAMTAWRGPLGQSFPPGQNSERKQVVKQALKGRAASICKGRSRRRPREYAVVATNIAGLDTNGGGSANLPAGLERESSNGHPVDCATRARSRAGRESAIIQRTIVATSKLDNETLPHECRTV